MSRKLRFLQPALLAGLVIITPALLAAESPVEEQAAVVFPPSWQPADILRAAARADVEMVRLGALNNIAIITLPDEAAGDRIRRSGAWLILPPGALGGCLQRRLS
ncbi:hypothetical protein [Maricaulis sp. CAU 1757]